MSLPATQSAMKEEWTEAALEKFVSPLLSRRKQFKFERGPPDMPRVFVTQKPLFERLARLMDLRCEEFEQKLHAFTKLYYKHLSSFLSSYAGAGPLRLALRAAPRWLARAALLMRDPTSCLLTQQRGIRRRARQAAAASRLLARVVDSAYSAALPARTRRVSRRVWTHPTHAKLWDKLCCVTLRKLLYLLPMTDISGLGEELLTPYERRVADVLLLSPEEEAITEEVANPEAPGPLYLLLEMVEKYKLEDKETPLEAWKDALKEYASRGPYASCILLQRRWSALKRAARARVLRACRQRAATSPLYVEVVRRYPHVVTAPLPTWTDLLDDNRVLLLDTKDDGLYTGETNNTNDQGDDDDLVVIEKAIDTVEVDDDDSDDDERLVIDDQRGNFDNITENNDNIDSNTVKATGNNTQVIKQEKIATVSMDKEFENDIIVVNDDSNEESCGTAEIEHLNALKKKENNTILNERDIAFNQNNVKTNNKDDSSLNCNTNKVVDGNVAIEHIVSDLNETQNEDIIVIENDRIITIESKAPTNILVEVVECPSDEALDKLNDKVQEISQKSYILPSVDDSVEKITDKQEIRQDSNTLPSIEDFCNATGIITGEIDNDTENNDDERLIIDDQHDNIDSNTEKYTVNNKRDIKHVNVPTVLMDKEIRNEIIIENDDSYDGNGCTVDIENLNKVCEDLDVENIIKTNERDIALHKNNIETNFKDNNKVVDGNVAIEHIVSDLNEPQTKDIIVIKNDRIITNESEAPTNILVEVVKSQSDEASDEFYDKIEKIDILPFVDSVEKTPDKLRKIHQDSSTLPSIEDFCNGTEVIKDMSGDIDPNISLKTSDVVKSNVIEILQSVDPNEVQTSIIFDSDNDISDPDEDSNQREFSDNLDNVVFNSKDIISDELDTVFENEVTSEKPIKRVISDLLNKSIDELTKDICKKNAENSIKNSITIKNDIINRNKPRPKSKKPSLKSKLTFQEDDDSEENSFADKIEITNITSILNKVMEKHNNYLKEMQREPNATDKFTSDNFEFGEKSSNENMQIDDLDTDNEFLYDPKLLMETRVILTRLNLTKFHKLHILERENAHLRRPVLEQDKHIDTCLPLNVKHIESELEKDRNIASVLQNQLLDKDEYIDPLSLCKPLKIMLERDKQIDELVLLERERHIMRLQRERARRKARRRVRLPSLDAVRKRNSFMLTAQVAPLQGNEKTNDIEENLESSEMPSQQQLMDFIQNYANQGPPPTPSPSGPPGVSLGTAGSRRGAIIAANKEMMNAVKHAIAMAEWEADDPQDKDYLPRKKRCRPKPACKRPPTPEPSPLPDAYDEWVRQKNINTQYFTLGQTHTRDKNDRRNNKNEQNLIKINATVDNNKIDDRNESIDSNDKINNILSSIHDNVEQCDKIENKNEVDKTNTVEVTEQNVIKGLDINEKQNDPQYKKIYIQTPDQINDTQQKIAFQVTDAFPKLGYSSRSPFDNNNFFNRHNTIENSDSVETVDSLKRKIFGDLAESCKRAKETVKWSNEPCESAGQKVVDKDVDISANKRLEQINSPEYREWTRQRHINNIYFELPHDKETKTMTKPNKTAQSKTHKKESKKNIIKIRKNLCDNNLKLPITKIATSPAVPSPLELTSNVLVQTKSVHTNKAIYKLARRTNLNQSLLHIDKAYKPHTMTYQINKDSTITVNEVDKTGSSEKLNLNDPLLSQTQVVAANKPGEWLKTYKIINQPSSALASHLKRKMDPPPVLKSFTERQMKLQSDVTLTAVTPAVTAVGPGAMTKRGREVMLTVAKSGAITAVKPMVSLSSVNQSAAQTVNPAVSLSPVKQAAAQPVNPAVSLSPVKQAPAQPVNPAVSLSPVKQAAAQPVNPAVSLSPVKPAERLTLTLTPLTASTTGPEVITVTQKSDVTPVTVESTASAVPTASVSQAVNPTVSLSPVKQAPAQPVKPAESMTLTLSPLTASSMIPAVTVTRESDVTPVTVDLTASAEPTASVSQAVRGVAVSPAVEGKGSSMPLVSVSSATRRRRAVTVTVTVVKSPAVTSPGEVVDLVSSDEGEGVEEVINEPRQIYQFIYEPVTVSWYLSNINTTALLICIDRTYPFWTVENRYLVVTEQLLPCRDYTYWTTGFKNKIMRLIIDNENPPLNVSEIAIKSNNTDKIPAHNDAYFGTSTRVIGTPEEWLGASAVADNRLRCNKPPEIVNGQVVKKIRDGVYVKVVTMVGRASECARLRRRGGEGALLLYDARAAALQRSLDILTAPDK